MGSAPAEVTALIEVLLQTGKRLEELTDGQIDTVVDREGRTLLLRGTHEQLRGSDAARQKAILDALPAHVAMLDSNGAVVMVNDAWRRFAADNFIENSDSGVGRDDVDTYAAYPLESADSRTLAEGIRSVLVRERRGFSMECACRWPARENCFLIVVAPLADYVLGGAVVMHVNITARKRAESMAILLNDRLALAISVAKLGVWEWELATDLLTWDATMFKIYGLPTAVSMTYQKWTLTVHPDDRSDVEKNLRRIIDQMQPGNLEFRIIQPNGAVRKISAAFGTVLDGNSNVARLVGVNMDVTERKDAEELLFAEKERAQVTLNSIGDAVISTDSEGTVTFLNLAAEKMTGWSAQEAAGKPISEVFATLDSESRRSDSNPMETAVGLQPDVKSPSNCILIRRDGIETPIEDSVAPIHDRNGFTSGAVIVFRDVSPARDMALRLAFAAQHDSLTGLPNRMVVNDRINQAIALAPRHGKKIAVLFLDLDGFKHINDSLGHAIGDKLLQSVAERLGSCVRGSDTVSRQGGDEFVVLLAEVVHSEDAAITARRMLSAVAQPHPIGQHDLHVTASIGLSISPDDGYDAEVLIKNADIAMYQAKENGRQNYQFFESAMNVRAVERQSIEESLRRARERQELQLHYQPKINLRNGRITGAEALIRWTHPVRGSISPGQFIPVAEDSGLILPIGNWVLREACTQAQAWARAGLRLATIAVNISALEFRDENFLESVFKILNDTGLDPGSLELELTESVLMKRPEKSQVILKTLRSCGVQIAVDDFGTGYSSLSYLRKFSIDSLKIDQSFVRQVTSSPDDTAIVSAVISMGRSLNLRVVAEGVETLEEMQFLQMHRCDEAQGFYFSRPLSSEHFAKLLENGISEKGAFDSIPWPEVHNGIP